MSLVSFATRLIVTRALKGRTFAGDRVVNSPVEPLDDVLADDAPAQPMIAVFSGASTAEATGRDMLGGERSLDVMIQVFIPPGVEVGDPALRFAARDAGAAALIDFVWRQASAALVRDVGPWQSLFAKFVAGIHKITATPILYEIAGQKNVGRGRIPACEYTLECRTVTEPSFGRPLANHWLALDAAMRAEAELAPLADLIKGMIEQPDDLPDWRVAMATLGLSAAAMRASGLAPQDATEEGEAAQLAEDGLTIDPAVLTDQVAVLP